MFLNDGQRADGGGRGERAAGKLADPMPVLRARGEQFVASHCERVAKAGLEVQGQSRESVLVAKSNFQSMSCAGTSLTLPSPLIR